MAACSPQRYLANNRNVVRTAATLTPSTVLPVANSVLELPVARDGTGSVVLSGDYAGAEEATFDVEVVDNTITTSLVSVPVFTGAGSGVLSNIVSTGTAQTYTLSLQNAGLPLIQAGIDFEGVRIIARAIGAAGNDIEIEIDQSSLVFTPQSFSLLTELQAGTGGPTTGIKGAAFDWNTSPIGVDGVIPTAAHRIAFGDDTGDVYLQYKKFVDGEWFYHFVPAIKRHIPEGTVISFVTGGRTVTVTDTTPTTESFVDIKTVYDLLNAFITTSTIVTVEGVVAYDRSPIGMAAKELLVRTDAHVEPSTGSGSTYATGFIDTFANANAATELVIARCFAISSRDHPLAAVGAERWHLQGSVSGALGDMVSGDVFVDPDSKFGLTIERKLSENYGVRRARFTHTDTIYVSRDAALKPPVCPVALTLGPEAVDQTLRLIWTQRPSGDCLCNGMSVPRLSAFCLGLLGGEGGSNVYAADTITRLTDLYDWYRDEVIVRSGFMTGFGFQDPVIAVHQPSIPLDLTHIPLNPPFESLKEVIADFEETIALLDPVTDTTYRNAGMTAWDAAVSALKYDVDGQAAPLFQVPHERYLAALNVALISGGISPLGKSDASIIQSGDGCWLDMGTDYWTITGSVQGKYAPVFNNTPYYSSVLAEDGNRYFSSHEFGFQINVKCPELLVYGDEIDLTIGNAGYGSTYQVGDELVLPILAAQPLTLAGGQDGNDVLDWYVSGSVDGALPNFEYDPNASPPGDYSQTGLAFTFTPGGVDNEAGDRFVFTVEGGHWRYRKDGGAWTSLTADDITDVVSSFVDGLSIQWLTGAAPSFAVGDTYSFRVAQPWAVSNLQSPDRYRWQWDEAAPTLVIDCGSAVPVSMASIARHTLPTGATVLLEGGTTVGVYTWSQALTWDADTIAAEFTEQQAQYLRLTMTGASGGGIGWLWAGTPLTTEYSAQIALRRVYKLETSGAGLDQSGNYLGRAHAGSIGWTEAALSESDVAGIAALLDWAKTNNDEPFVFVPNITRPTEAFCVLIAADDVEFDEISDYNRDANYDRRYSIEVPFAGVWR